MKNVVILGLAVLAMGCASSKDVQLVQGQIDNLSSAVSSASIDAKAASSQAVEASAKASAAESAANKAADSLAEINAKLDILFVKAKQK